MALNIPTTSSITAQNLATFETALGQDAPINDKAFLRVESAIQAMLFTTLYKYGADRILQSLAITARLDGLKIIGQNYGVTYNTATAAQLIILLPAVVGTTIPSSVNFVADDTNVEYYPTATVVAGAGGAVITINCRITGTSGNLAVGQTLTMTTAISNASQAAAVTSIVTLGEDDEDVEVYRRRVLDEIRTVGGGSNSADYRRWAEAVTDVARAYPYSGLPVTMAAALTDGDMETAGLAAWTAGAWAVLTKSATLPHTGTQALRVTYAGANNPYAAQECFDPGQKYLLTGYARGDTTYAPCVQNQAGVDLWTGAVAATWQAFSINFTPTDTWLILGSNCTAAGWVEFDDLELELIDMPGQRTVYVECVPAVEADGIAPQWLLDNVRDELNEDPITGESRPALGTTDEDLYVEPITRTTFNIRIQNLQVPTEIETQVQTDISTALTEYFLSVEPFITALDYEGDQKNTITQLSVADVVQDVLSNYGGYANSVLMAPAGSVWLPSYVLGANEKAKLGTITYA